MSSDVIEKTVLSDQTPIKIGSVGAGLAMLIACVWWASGVSSRLATIEVYMSHEVTKTATVTDIVNRVKQLEMFGTPKAILVEEKLNKLREDFELHKAISKESSSK
jgi:hypothetical protein